MSEYGNTTNNTRKISNIYVPNFDLKIKPKKTNVLIGAKSTGFQLPVVT
jgi:hypothetical protein